MSWTQTEESEYGPERPPAWRDNLRYSAALWAAAAMFYAESAFTVALGNAVIPQGDPDTPLSGAFYLVVGPVLSIVAAMCLALPTVLFSRWSASRAGRPETWWWCAASCAAAMLALVVILPVMAGAAPRAVVVLKVWLGLTAFATPAALAARGAANGHRFTAWAGCGGGTLIAAVVAGLTVRVSATDILPG
ncbi:hypothetical protein AB0M28_12780 [Streptomyces sp. NPDC051940]|uniref:hypothetical protein n=1 Tax=Streptomyces sp. NPDC051940 TaxID=3155675 RepID=UPI00344545BA